ncbi:MAG: ATP-dependent DNA helicase, partial [Tenericutes bacterium]
AVTFTNKAANEMKERVIELIGKNGVGAQISTYHSFAVRILRKEIEVLGYPSNFNILDDIDQKMILKPIYKTLNLSSKTMSPRIVLENISKFKMNGTSPEEALEQAKSDTDKALAKMYKGYMKQKEQIRSLDFDDLLLFVDKIFNENPEIAQK